MTHGPDLCEPVLGFRAWRVGDDGLLRPWAFPDEPWTPGPNEARCRTHSRHRPPVADCMCGLYGLADPADSRLSGEGDQAVGAIAAWGDLEVHRTGFRAQTACILALARETSCSPEKLERLKRAAAGYDVALVSRAELALVASLYASPAPAEAPPAPDGAESCPVWLDDRFAGSRRGVAADEHLWAETRVGEIRLGLTDALGARLRRLDGSFPLPPVGRRVEAGEVLTVLGTERGESFYLWAPVAGTVTAVNPRLAAEPELAVADPARDGWLLALAPSSWSEQWRRFLWGRAARRYAVALAAADPFADLHVERLRALPLVQSWGDVRAAVAREREAPWFAGAEEVYARLGAAVATRLAADAAVRATVRRFGADILLRLTGPDAVLCITSAGELRCGDEAPPSADLVLTMSADLAHDFFTGLADPTVELRTGAMRASLPRGRALVVLSALHGLRIARLPRLATWDRITEPTGSGSLLP